MGLIVLVPFHAPLTVWLTSVGTNYDLVRLWKEFLLIGLIILALPAVIKNRRLRSEMLGDWLIRLTLVFILLVAANATVVLLNGTVEPRAVIFGLITHTRMWLILLVVMIAVKRGLLLQIPKGIVYPAVIVVMFGLAQMFVLPADFLKHLGYGPDTILPYQAVDNNPDFPRVQATMRGANPLGAYLIPVGLLLVAGWQRLKDRRVGIAAMLTITTVVMFGTHSRSAWLGAVLAGALYLGMQLKPGNKKLAGIVLTALILLAGASVYVLRDNDFIQNSLFHSSEHSPSATSSNEQRLSALTYGLKDITSYPLGGGVGSAGPASFHNDEAKLSENFFVQIGQELGIAGLAAYLCLVFVVTRRLYVSRRHKVILAALSAFAGLLVVNMLSHAWTDDTLAYIMGALLAYAIWGYNDVQNAYKERTISSKTRRNS